MSNHIHTKNFDIKQNIIAFLIILLVFVKSAEAAIQHDPSLSWKTIHTPHFLIHYHDGEAELAQEVSLLAEQVHVRLSQYFNWTPKERTNIVLTDRYDFGLGVAQAFPFTKMTLHIQSADGMIPPKQLLELLIIHEYTHILHIDKARGTPNKLRSVFGRYWLTFPNTFQPVWFIEGLGDYIMGTTDKDSLGVYSFYETLIRLEVDNGIKPLRQVNQPISTWPGFNTPYLYGANFYRFIRDTRGEEQVQQLIEQYSDNILPYFINRNSKQVLGHNLDRLWTEFSEYLEKKHKPVLDSIEKNGIQEGTRLTFDGDTIDSIRELKNGTLFYIKNDGINPPSIMKRSAGTQKNEHFVEITGGNIDVHIKSGIILSQMERNNNANIYYDLYHIDLETKAIKRLTHGKRYNSAAWSPDGKYIAALKQERRITSLHLLNQNGELIEELWTVPHNESMNGLDWSPDGSSLIFSYWHEGQGWNLELFDIAEKRWKKLTKDTSVKLNPRYTADGNNIIFSADYGGIFNIQKLELETGKISTLSNIKGAALQASPSKYDGSIYYANLGANGSDLYKLTSETQKEFITPNSTHKIKPAAQALTISLEKMEITDYSPFSGLKPRWWSPVLETSSDRKEIGFSTSSADPLLRHTYNLSFAYDSENQLPLGEISYVYDRFQPLWRLNVSIDHDLEKNESDVLMRIRRSKEAQVEMILPFLRVNNRWALNASLLQDEITDEKVLSGFTGTPTRRDNNVGLALMYDSTFRYRLSVSRSNGRNIALIAEDSDLINSDYSGQVYTLDWREFVHLAHQHVFTLRAVVGWGTDKPRTFNLGGSQTAQSLDVSAAVFQPLPIPDPFNQRQYALRGYPEGLPKLTGRRMALASLEWRFPITRIERGFMTPPVGINYLAGRLFSDHGVTSNTEKQKIYSSAGVELEFNLVLFYSLPIQTRLGYAHGFEANGGNRFYLSLGESF